MDHGLTPTEHFIVYLSAGLVIAIASYLVYDWTRPRKSGPQGFEVKLTGETPVTEKKDENHG